ncbi:MAG TPA: hypothetical protein VM802_22530 [Chitinophaga sp.]|uniref:hypothetical protein n=1 Tax=Chitinophaga sp. TaxID=1869181 RepID=UPI002C0937B8|nr:hypothetical protein [Chitinophaga sp.]HVI47665.1 hypothetical protein [Chitinophaga sp.]
MKTWLYLPLLMLGLIFTSCRKEEITNQVIPNKTILFTVRTSDWKAVPNTTNTYAVILPVSEIQAVTDGVIVSIADLNGNTFELLPEVVGNKSFNVIHYPGSVRVELASTNGAAIQLPQDLTMKVVVIPANQIQ